MQGVGQGFQAYRMIAQRIAVAVSVGMVEINAPNVSFSTPTLRGRQRAKLKATFRRDHRTEQ